MKAAADEAPPIQRQVGAVAVLMYHDIGDGAAARFANFVVPRARFQEHLAAVQEAGFETLTISQLLEVLASGGALHRPVACVTFDDGFASFLDEALPQLVVARVPATLYLPTAFVGGRARWLNREGESDRRLLTWQQVAEVASQGIECGAHSHRHLPLDIVPRALAEEDVRTSKLVLEDHLGHRVDSFCYPFGYHSAHIRQAVQNAGFTSACAVGWRLHSISGNSLAIQRLHPTARTTPARLLELMQGRGPKMVPNLLAANQLSWRVYRWSRAYLSSTLTP
jgi:peptidoglycan/xylan/chitin deacetylase (PgdA/CDA1 family)